MKSVFRRRWRGLGALALTLILVLVAGVAHSQGKGIAAARRLLSKLKSVDGAGSGLDADTIRGMTLDDLQRLQPVVVGPPGPPGGVGAAGPKGDPGPAGPAGPTLGALGGACPDQMLNAGAYCIDLEPTPRNPDLDLGGNWAMAALACRKAGKRLCTPGEWFGACADGLIKRPGALECEGELLDGVWIDGGAPTALVGSRGDGCPGGTCELGDAKFSNTTANIGFRCCQ